MREKKLPWPSAQPENPVPWPQYPVPQQGYPGGEPGYPAPQPVYGDPELGYRYPPQGYWYPQPPPAPAPRPQPTVADQRFATRLAAVFVIATAVVEIATGILEFLWQMGWVARGGVELEYPSMPPGMFASLEDYRTYVLTWFVGTLVAIAVDAALMTVASVYLLRRHRWARVLATCAIAMTLGIIYTYGGLYSLPTITLGVASVVLLFRRPVTAYLVRPEPVETGPEGPTRTDG